MVGEVGSLVLLSINEGTTAIETIDYAISSWFRKALFLKEHIIHIFLLITFHRIGRNSPKTDPLGFINLFIKNLRGFEDISFDGFETIEEYLLLFRSFIQNTTSKDGNVDDKLKELSNNIRCAAYEADYLINSCVAGACPEWCRSSWLSEFEEQMKLVRETIEDMSEGKVYDNMNINNVGSSNNPSHAQSMKLLPTTDLVVGFEKEMELLMDRLVSDSRKLDVVSIVGMPGLGKTTLAKKVYDDPAIVDHFQVRSWCCVSQEYNKKELLLSILGCMIEVTDLIRRMSDGDLSLLVHKQLSGRRYLIVMDDVWGMDAFRDMKRFFPDNGNRSRIILTSRNRLEDFIDPFELRFLTDDESWDLLKHKVFQNEEECPPGLYQVGKTIAEKCRGLPLAIVVVSGILCKSEKDCDFWDRVAGNLSTYIAGDAFTHGQVMEALELSYKFLPDYLKPLFLYLGAFPEDKEIPANKLMWLWIAEGFLHHTDQLKISLEVQAERYLMDLVDRSLIMISERRSDGRVKSCRVHDLLRDMCSEKAKEENFMRQMNVHDELPNPLTYERRLSISLNSSCKSRLVAPQGPFITGKGLPMVPISHPLTSFLFFNMNNTLGMSEEAKKTLFEDFRLLRILHSESIIIDTDLFRDYVVRLVHLRYISIRTYWNLIPSSISNLRNLETLIIKGLRGEIEVPGEILTMLRLRHLHINDRANFNRGLSESSSKLEDLETLSTPAVRYEEEKKLTERLPNIRKLRCIFVEPRYFGSKYQLPQLESLNQLESLKMLRYGRLPHSGKFGLPSTLRKLTLSKFGLEWSEISSLQNLPNLEVLKLRGGAVEGALWETGDGEFLKLKFLKLESLNIKQWNVSADNFPCLQRLVFKSCKQLEEIPSSVGDFYSLEKMEVVWCSTSASNSAKMILEDQKDAGNELLKIQIYMSS